MTRYVISREYGALVEGYQASQEALQRAIQWMGTGIACAAEVALHAHERGQWVECMRACPVFVA